MNFKASRFFTETGGKFIRKELIGGRRRAKLIGGKLELKQMLKLELELELNGSRNPRKGQDYNPIRSKTAAKATNHLSQDLDFFLLSRASSSDWNN